MANMFRLLQEKDIDLRAATVSKEKCSLLLYKDARCDMAILDETFGTLGWKRTHEVINGNLYCNVSVYNGDTKEWVTKQDVGTESQTEKEKGQASDSFKRACFNWGIGRELYTAPSIWIDLYEGEAEETFKDNYGKQKYRLKAKFRVKEIEYSEDREINKLVIVDSYGRVRYKFGEVKEHAPQQETQQQQQEQQQQPEKKPDSKPKKLLTAKQVNRLYAIASEKGYNKDVVNKHVKSKYKVDDPKEMTKEQYDEICSGYEHL